jgi:NTE family protein
MQVNEADGIFQGGGAKAIALAGALLGFAERGYARWVDVAGAGSGAIVAAYLACGHDAYDTEQLLRSAPYSRFEDYGLGGPLRGTWNLLRRGGLARGEYLRLWLDEQLGGCTFGSIMEAGRSRLKLIAVDVTRREPLILPDDLPRYRLQGDTAPIDPERFPIAAAVRLSMSLPYIFQPETLVHHETGRPSTIVDGSLAPLPVWIFDAQRRDAVRPTFAIRLTGSSGPLRAAGAPLARWSPLTLGSDISCTALESWDPRFVPLSSRLRTCVVSTGEIDTTDFVLTPLEQTELVERGRRAARRFLDSFDLGAYRNTHSRNLAAAVPAY